MKSILALTSAALLVFGVAGCTVEKTEDGAMPTVDVDAKGGNLPKYEVKKTEDGSLPDVDVNATAGKLPKYDVDTAKVSVDSTTATVTVPEVDVRTEEKTIKVPDVNVTMPNEQPKNE